MILVDEALKRRQDEGNPIRVGLVGAGFMGSAIALQLLTSAVGMRLVAIGNRHLDKAMRAYRPGGAKPVTVSGAGELDEAIAAGRPAVTENLFAVAEAESIDVVLEVTGAIEFGAHFAVRAIEHGKHLVLVNTDLDSTVGSILKRRADERGVVYTNAEGDQPGDIVNLYRFVKGTGIRPVLCGNIKGLHDPYRNPTTQAEFARTWGQNPRMVTSFADGTKISFEQAIVANASGMNVARRGMLGPAVEPGTPIDEAVKLFPEDVLLSGPGIVDYVVGAKPGPGVFVLGTHEDPRQQRFLSLFKLGDGPMYCFTMPFHLCHFEVPNSVARAAIYGDAAIAPLEGPRVDVVAAAKTDLEAGQTLDGIGGYTLYGLCENTPVVRKENLLLLGLSEGCRLKRDVPKDAVLTNDDVEVPEGRLCDRLRAEQDEVFAPDRREPVAYVA